MGNTNKPRPRNVERLWRDAITSRDVTRVQLIVEALYGETQLEGVGWIFPRETTPTLYLRAFQIMGEMYPHTHPPLKHLAILQKEICTHSILLLETK